MKRTDKMLLGGLGVLGAGAVAYFLFRGKKDTRVRDALRVAQANEIMQADQEAGLKISESSTKMVKTRSGKDMVAFDRAGFKKAAKAATAVTQGRRVPTRGSVDRLDTWVSALNSRSLAAAAGPRADCKAQGGIAKMVYPEAWKNAKTELSIWQLSRMNKFPCDPVAAAQFTEPVDYYRRGSCPPPNAWVKVAMVDAGLRHDPASVECIPGRGGISGLTGIGSYVVSSEGE
jgi:uncharacterized protein YjeT (DUF2065 family)